MFSLIKQWKLTDLTVKNIVSTDDSVKRQITDSISENLTDSDLESGFYFFVFNDCLFLRWKIRHYRSELWDHLFFDDCLNYLNFNSVSDEICTLNNVKAIKIIFKISLEWSRFVKFWRSYCKKSPGHSRVSMWNRP